MVTCIEEEIKEKIQFSYRIPTKIEHCSCSVLLQEKTVFICKTKKRILKYDRNEVWMAYGRVL